MPFIAHSKSKENPKCSTLIRTLGPAVALQEAERTGVWDRALAAAMLRTAEDLEAEEREAWDAANEPDRFDGGRLS